MISTEAKALAAYTAALCACIAVGVVIGAAAVGVYIGVKDRAFWLDTHQPAPEVRT